MDPVSFAIGGVIGLVVGFPAGWFTRASVHEGAEFKGGLSFNFKTGNTDAKWHMIIKGKPNQEINREKFEDDVGECLRETTHHFNSTKKPSTPSPPTH
jgi:hypothetical protein